MGEPEPANHNGWRKHHSGTKTNRIRRTFGEDQEDNEIDDGNGKDLHNNDDEDDVDLDDDDDDDVAGSGFLYEENTHFYSTKPSRLCK